MHPKPVGTASRETFTPFSSSKTSPSLPQARVQRRTHPQHLQAPSWPPTWLSPREHSLVPAASLRIGSACRRALSAAPSSSDFGTDSKPGDRPHPTPWLWCALAESDAGRRSSWWLVCPVVTSAEQRLCSGGRPPHTHPRGRCGLSAPQPGLSALQAECGFLFRDGRGFFPLCDLGSSYNSALVSHHIPGELRENPFLVSKSD